MKPIHRSKLLIFLMSFLNAFSFSQHLATYYFEDNNPCPHNPNTTVNIQPDNATFSAFSSVGTTCYPLPGSFTNSDWQTSSSVNLGEYNQFTITVASGYLMDITAIQFLNKTSSSWLDWHIRCSLDNFSTDICDGNIGPDWYSPLCSITNLGNISNAVTFRFYVTGVNSTSTYWAMDEIRIEGTVSQNPNALMWYADVDNDDFGNENNSEFAEVSTLPNATLIDGDCNDANASIHPGVTDIPDNGIDEDCSGQDASTASMIELNHKTVVFPNPIQDKFEIESPHEIVGLLVYDLSSVLVSSLPINESTVNLAHLSSGLYLLKVLFKNQEPSIITVIKQ